MMMIDIITFYIHPYPKVLIKTDSHKSVKIWYDSKKHLLLAQDILCKNLLNVLKFNTIKLLETRLFVR